MRISQQLTKIDPPHDVSVCRIDARDEVGFVDVRPQLASHPLQLVEHPDAAIRLAHRNRAQLAEPFWIDHANPAAAVAHVEQTPVRGQSPSLTCVREAVYRGQRGGVIHVAAPTLPCQLIDPIPHASYSFSEFCRRQRHPATNAARRRIHDTQIRQTDASGAFEHAPARECQPLRVSRGVVRRAANCARCDARSGRVERNRRRPRIGVGLLRGLHTRRQRWRLTAVAVTAAAARRDR